MLIFLPGIGDVPEDYQLNGFIDAVQRGGTEADMIAVDLHLGYYVRRAAFERLRHDVILPARDQGYGEIDLVGISLGGFGALYYAMQHSEDIARLVLLAPYLGDAPVIKEITAAGGLRKWHPREITEHDYQRKLWQSLKGEAGNSVLSRLYLGYGLDDKFAPANRLLADLLPQDHVVAIAGRHHWGTWIRVWENLLNGLKTQQP